MLFFESVVESAVVDVVPEAVVSNEVAETDVVPITVVDDPVVGESVVVAYSVELHSSKGLINFQVSPQLETANAFQTSANLNDVMIPGG